METAGAAIPRVASFAPKASPAGGIVTIAGENFSPALAENIVYFGAVRGAVTSASGTELQVRVPAGATFAPVTVVVNGLTAHSAEPFLPTFPGDGSAIGPGTLTRAFTSAAPLGPGTAVLADLDNDGKSDLVIGNGRARSIWLLRNICTNGTLSATSFETPIEVPAGDLYKMTTADVDGDGMLDLVVASVGTNEVSIFRNTTPPTPGAAISLAPRLDIQVGADCRFARAADLDGDGKVDIAAVNYGESTISILKNIGSPGSLTAGSFAPRINLATPTGPYELAIGDLDNDGISDLAVATYGQALAVFRNLSTSGLLDTNSFTRFDFPAAATTDTIEIGDIDQDGKLDLLVGTVHPMNMAVYRNLGGSPFSSNSLAERVEFPADHWVHNVVLADFNGDGKPDPASVGELQSYLSIFQNLSTPLSFTPASLGPRVDYSSGWNAWGLAVGDLDGDGRPDAAFANHWDNTFTVYQNNTPFAGPPIIIAQPADQTVALTEDATFTVRAAGSAQLNYQWWHAQAIIPEATNATFTLTETSDTDAGSYFVVVANSYGAVTSSIALLTLTNLAPYITVQPQDKAVLRDADASFSVTARGTRPFAYQWRFNGTNLAGATASLLNLTNVQRSNAGGYSVEITNALGAVTSRVAALTVIVPPANIIVANTNVISGWPATVTVLLDANGDENALSFSLTFGGSQRGSPLSFIGAAPGLAAQDGILVVNTNHLPFGRVGIAVALPAGATFAKGLREVALLTFDTTVVTQTKPVIQYLYFGDQPLPRQVSDPLAISLPSGFTSGSVTLLPTDVEGDLTPRPGGDRALTINDWVQAGRFVAALDVPGSESEFQRSDCAPRGTRGDGQLKVTDWVQAGRYFARLDPLTSVGGPLVPEPPLPLPKKLGRQVRVVSVSAIQALEVVVPLELEAQGDENGLGFTLLFDAALLQYRGTVLGSGAGGAALNVNSLQASSGTLGLLMALPTGNAFPAGTRELAKISFLPIVSTSGSSAIGFADAPVLRAVSDPAANELTADYVAGAVYINPLPFISIIPSGQDVTLSWPVWAAGFDLQTSVGNLAFPAEWTNLPASPETNSETFRLKLPLTPENRFFRLHHSPDR